jgi:hypothetical protein
MKLSFFHEPELEFGNSGTHVDIRYGIIRHGPLDLGETSAPSHLRIGLVGTEETITAFREWLDRCRGGIAAKPSKLSNLFAPFLGFSELSPFHASLIFNDRWCSSIRQRELDAVLRSASGNETVRAAVGIFVDHAASLIEQGGPMVLVCIPPKDLLAAVDERVSTRPDILDQEIDEGSETVTVDSRSVVDFHDLLKAEGMRLGIPIQMVRPQTYTGEQKRKGVKGKRAASTPLQDEATRAWNIHTALYYKAGGIPWRLLRSASELSSCFVGISFYRSISGDRLLTSVAQVFNERGEGVIVKGAQAQLGKDDRQPHLSENDSRLLLKNAVDLYRKEHRTSPARLVVHKTSKLTDGEMRGFRAAADEHRVDLVELVSIKRSFARLFREGTYPPLRGTFLRLQPSTGLLYLRGSVQFFETYPGMYVPRALEFSVAHAEATPDQLAREMLSLSKLNWNNTQFDGGEPITVRAARRVGDILKCVPEGGSVQPSFRFYM